MWDMKKWIVMLMAVALVALMVFATVASAGDGRILNVGKGNACSGAACQGVGTDVIQNNLAGAKSNVNGFVGFAGGSNDNEPFQFIF